MIKKIVSYTLIFFFYKINSNFIIINNQTGHNIDINFTSIENNYENLNQKYPISRLEDKRLYEINLDKIKDGKDLIISYSYGLRKLWTGKIIIPFSNIESLTKKFPGSSFLLTLRSKKLKKYVIGFNLPELTIISDLKKHKGLIHYNLDKKFSKSTENMILNFNL